MLLISKITIFSFSASHKDAVDKVRAEDFVPDIEVEQRPIVPWLPETNIVIIARRHDAPLALNVVESADAGVLFSDIHDVGGVDVDCLDGAVSTADEKGSVVWAPAAAGQGAVDLDL